MSALVGRIRHEFATTSAVRRACDRLDELQVEYDRHPCHSAGRREIGADIADCLQTVADGLEAAKLPRVFALFDPDSLRRDMAGWSNGDDMSGEETCPHG